MESKLNALNLALMFHRQLDNLELTSDEVVEVAEKFHDFLTEEK